MRQLILIFLTFTVTITCVNSEVSKNEDLITIPKVEFLDNYINFEVVNNKRTTKLLRKLVKDSIVDLDGIGIRDSVFRIDKQSLELNNTFFIKSIDQPVHDVWVKDTTSKIES